MPRDCTPDGRRGRARRARAGGGRPRCGARASSRDSRRSFRAASTSSFSATGGARRSAATRRSWTSHGACACRFVATNGVRYARAKDKELHDVLTAIRNHVPLDAAGRLLAAQRERHFKDAGAMRELFADLPGAVDAAAELSARLDFTLADLGYRFPEYPLPPGETPSSYLRRLTLERRPLALPAADGEGAGADREGARDDREARPRRLLPDRPRRRALLPREPHPRPGARLGRQQRRLLRALDHGGRPGEDGAALRALPLGGARRVARHRPRPAVGRSARARHPARLSRSTARTAPA